MWHTILAQGGGFYFPPLHPIFVDFTAGLIPISFGFDLLGAWLRKESFRTVGWWTFLAAAVITPVTVALGWIWMASMGGMNNWAMPWHMWIGIGTGIALLPMAAWRGWLYWQQKGPRWFYAAAAAVVLFALMVQGDLGGAMSLGNGIVFNTTPTKANVAIPSKGPIHWKEHLEITK